MFRLLDGGRGGGLGATALGRAGAMQGQVRGLSAAARAALKSAVAVLPLAGSMAPFLTPPLSAQAPDFDVIIRSGWIVDGTGNPGYRGDIGIRGDEIVAIGFLPHTTARRVVHAAGLVVTPGFIDLHAHADTAMSSDSMAQRRVDSFVTQGITTVASGMDGRAFIWPLPAQLAAYEKGMTLNVVPLIGFNAVRDVVMGDDGQREATPQEIRRMQELVREAMEAGAWGFAAGLEYAPGRFAASRELIEVARIVAEYDGFYSGHPRAEAVLPLSSLPSQLDTWPVDGFQALEETISIARETGIRVLSTHIKARGRSSFGRSHRDVELVEQARQQGLQVYLDNYPYHTYGVGPRPVVPRWPFADLRYGPHTAPDDSPFWREVEVSNDNLRRRLARPEPRKLIVRDIEYMVDHAGGADRIIILDHPDADLIGRTLADVAETRGQSYVETAIDFALNGHGDVFGGARLRGLGVHEADIEVYIQQEFTATASDGRPVMASRPASIGSHPRYMGNFVRKIARYAKDREVISLPFAIRSQTSLPAQIIGLRDRGYLIQGQKADIVIFDYERLRDHATIFEPDLPSEGVEYVLVNGEFILDKGQFSGAMPGVVIRRTGAPAPLTLRGQRQK